MSRRPVWKHTLEEARRQALVAIDFYNRPGDRRSLTDFIVHIHLAWQDLMHADRMRRKVEIFYRKNDKKRTFRRSPDGSKKTWDLSQCLRHENKDNDPIRKNIEFFIGLRNHVEHRYQDSVLVATAAESHACIINFESELVRRFGPSASLGNELKFPVFVQSLSPTRYEEQRALRRGLPLSTSTYIAEFQDALDDTVRSDERYAYRLLLLPMMGPLRHKFSHASRSSLASTTSLGSARSGTLGHSSLSQRNNCRSRRNCGGYDVVGRGDVCPGMIDGHCRVR